MKELKNISNREAWVAGIMLYWAEGSKEKENNVSVEVKFSNSDPSMIIFFIKWLKKYLRILDEDLIFEIIIHDNYEYKKDYFAYYWSKMLQYPVSKFDRIYYKKHKLKSNRKNQENKYHGQLVVKVRKSTDLNRKIAGWIEGFCKQCGIV